SVRILHLEANVFDAELVHQRLIVGGCGKQIELVQTEDEFRKALNTEGLQLILADYQFTGFDGLKALRLVRRAKPEIPFIFVSGEIDEELAIAALKAGAADFVMKDNLRRLPVAIESALAQAAARMARGKAEAAQRDLAQQWQNTFDAVSDAIFIVNDDHRIIRCNKAFLGMMGVAHEGEIRGRLCWELVHGTDKAIDGCPLEAMAKSGKRAVLEIPLGERWVEVVTEPFMLKGQVARRGGVHIMRDITVQKEALEKIYMNEERLEALNILSQMDNKDIDSILDYALRSLVKLTRSKAGYLHFLEQDTRIFVIGDEKTQERKVSMSFDRFHAALVKAGIWDECRRTMEPVVQNDFLAEARDYGMPTNHFPVQRHASVPLVDDGRIVAVVGVANKESDYDHGDTRQIYLFMSDMWRILKQKQFDLAIRNSEERNRRLAEEFAAILRSIPDSVKLLDTHLRILWGSGCGFSARLQSGVSPDDVKGMVCHEVFFQQKTPCSKCPILATFAGEGAIDKNVKLPNGRTYSIRTVPFRNQQGSVDQVLALARDVTEILSVEEQLRHAQKMESVGTMAGGIAHDFNNILCVIQGFTELLQLKLGPESPHLIAVSQILDASNRAASLVKGLLAFSRKREADFKPVDLKMVITALEKMLRRLLGVENSLSLRLTDENLIVEADSGHLDQILMNFAANARDVMSGGGHVEIETERVVIDEDFLHRHGFDGPPGDYALLRFRDNGLGMDEETQSRIFDPFFTTKEQGRGTGLGLSIVYGIVKQHHGFIDCQSQYGHGTEFFVYLPLTSSSPVQTQETSILQLRGGQAQRILLVEDDEPVRHILRVIMEEAGFVVAEASDGLEAVEMVRKQPDRFQAVVLDVVMPRKNGIEAYREIVGINPEIKALFVTGHQVDEALLVSDPGLHERFLYKPISPVELIQCLTALLSGK
ncbi:MAG: response regulator, partial [Desulfobulbaceae bacterium]|nr:response regulator [Desulfobulbaceae bacterium]